MHQNDELERESNKERHLLTWHADATKGAWIIQAGTIILAWMWLTLIHICLTAWPCEALCAVTCKRARCVDTDTIVLTWRSLLTLVYVLTAVHPLVTTCTGASVRTIDGACVTDCISMAGVRCAGIIQMAQQSCGIQTNTAGCTWLILGVPATHSTLCITCQVVHHHLVGNYYLCFQGRSSSPLNKEPVCSATSDSIWVHVLGGCFYPEEGSKFLPTRYTASHHRRYPQTTTFNTLKISYLTFRFNGKWQPS